MIMCTFAVALKGDKVSQRNLQSDGIDVAWGPGNKNLVKRLEEGTAWERHELVFSVAIALQITDIKRGTEMFATKRSVNPHIVPNLTTIRAVPVPPHFVQFPGGHIFDAMCKPNRFPMWTILSGGNK